jgi:hypothetical protein
VGEVDALINKKKDKGQETESPPQEQGSDKRRKHRVPIIPVSVALIAAVAGTAVTLIGVSNVPRWALALLTAGVTLVGAFASNSLTASKTDEKIISLWIAVALLVTILVGQWVFQATWAPAFVNLVPIRDITLSPTPGAPPRSNYDAPVLIGGEEQSTYCYVRIGKQIWLNFGTDGRRYLISKM